jgi:hypothetical protein
MSKHITMIVATAAVLTCAGVSLAGCGGSSEVVAEVGGASITRAAVNHWMNTLAGGDYHEVSRGYTLPAGIVSEPPNYKACEARLKAAIAAAPKAPPKPPELVTKCREIYSALKIQATSYLVKLQWLTAVYRAQGITTTPHEVLQFFKSQRTEQPGYRTETELHEYLTTRHLTLADLLLILKLDLLYQKFAAKATKESGEARIKLAEAEAHITAQTNCHSGFIVEYCKQYKKTQPTYPTTPPPAILMEQVTALVTGRCINLAACGNV